MPTATDLITTAAQKLTAAGIETARLDAEVLLRHLLGLSRTALFVRLREPVDPAIADRLDELIERRLGGLPVAYLTGEREFMGLPFAVGPGVLVPRPETELLVEWAAERMERARPDLVVDVGTGSGAIILALATIASPRDACFIGSDRSSEALGYAEHNRAELGLAQRVRLVKGDLLTWLGRPAGLILANLPYLRPDQVAANPDIHAEPELALISGDNGLDAINRLLDDSKRTLSPGGAMILELDPSQAAEVAVAAQCSNPSAGVQIVRDLAGFERFVTVVRP